LEKYDVIIVGSGLGGLVCGYILAKNGYKTAIFEKNAQIGGCLQTFTRKGVKFDTGMHYVGSMEDGQIMHKFFKYLNLLDDVELSPLNQNGFEVISILGKTYKYAKGSENFVETLSQYFPKNRSDIQNYVNQIENIANSSPLYNLQNINENPADTQYFTTSVNEFIDSCTANQELRRVLAGNLPLYAGIKDKTPVYIYALLSNSYIQSAYRIVGGSDSIALSLEKSINAFGGKIYRNAEVTELICDDKKMTKIKLKNGQEFEGQYFISNIHPQTAITKIHSPLLRKVYRDRIANIENTISTFTVFLIFKKNMVKYLDYNFYHYDTEDIWSVENYTSENYPLNYLYMHQAVEHGEKYAQSAQIITCMRFDEVQQWENTSVGKRGEEYEKFKRAKTEKIIDKLNEQFPNIKACIEDYYTSSPLTYRDYTATTKGAVYGILKDKNYPLQTRISQRTKIPNFFFTGQNINSHGILGVTIGAITTAADIAGKEKIIDEIL